MAIAVPPESSGRTFSETSERRYDGGRLPVQALGLGGGLAMTDDLLVAARHFAQPPAEEAQDRGTGGSLMYGFPIRQLSRRAVFTGVMCTALMGNASIAGTREPRFIAPPWSGYRSMVQRQAEASRLLTGDQPPATPRWRDDMDHSHFAGIAAAANLLDRPSDDPARRFDLTPEVLSALLAANELSPIERPRRMDPTLVLFALRGCTVIDPAQIGLRLDRIGLSVVELDYLNPRCVLGVWCRTENHIAVFAGSTVPNCHALQLQAAAFGQADSMGRVWRIANVLPTGRYEFVVGPHGGWQPTALRSANLRGAATIQPALRSSSGRLAWRDLTLDAGAVLDNVHPAMTPMNAHGAAFSSEGCLTLAEREPPTRWSASPPDWRAFTTMGEIRHRPVRERRLYSLALLTGVDAWLTAQGQPASRLRYGSKGSGVSTLRRAMTMPDDDFFDAAMLRRWMTAGQGAAPVAFPQGALDGTVGPTSSIGNDLA